MTAMTHRDILLRELREHGLISLRSLMDRYSARGYTKNGFAAAACRLRKKGVVAPADGRYGTIVLSGACPCCGRPYAKR